MLRDRFESLMKFDTEFGGAAEGGAEPLIDETEDIIIDDEEDGAEPPEDSQEETEESGAEPIDYTKEVSKRINKVREETWREAEARYADEKRQLIESLSSNKSNEHLEFLQALGQVNPYTGEVIETPEEYRAYRAAYDQAARESQPVDVEELVSKKVNEVLREQTVQQSAMQQFNSDIAKIGKVNPTIKTAKDIEVLPEAPEILQKVQRGYSVFDAYITTVKTQKPQSRVDTTGHMTPVGGNPSYSATIPNKVLKEYKAYGYSEKEAAADYAKKVRGK